MAYIRMCHQEKWLQFGVGTWPSIQQAILVEGLDFQLLIAENAKHQHGFSLPDHVDLHLWELFLEVFSHVLKYIPSWILSKFSHMVIGDSWDFDSTSKAMSSFILETWRGQQLGDLSRCDV